MTLLLETESHGKVEAGFYSNFTPFVRVGKHNFSTRRLCESVQHFARNHNVYEAQIFSYDLGRFWQMQREDSMQQLMQILLESEEPSFLESQESNLKRKSEGQLGEISIDDAIAVYKGRKIVPIRVTDDEGSISIGEYVLSALHFGDMALYFANGGVFGWRDGQKPEFAEQTINAIKSSQRELYRKIREELR